VGRGTGVPPRLSAEWEWDVSAAKAHCKMDCTRRLPCNVSANGESHLKLWLSSSLAEFLSAWFSRIRQEAVDFE
jgi:hypothetical protein